METTLAVTIVHDEGTDPVQLLSSELDGDSAVTAEVHVVTITHKYGHDIIVCRSHEKARQVVFDYASEWWYEVLDEMPRPSERDQLIQAYFSEVEDYEGYTIESAPII